MERRYADMTSMEAFPTSSVYPTKVYLFVNERKTFFPYKKCF